MSSQGEPEKEAWREKYNQKTIHALTYKEIIALNREKNKETFMDRSWREVTDKEGSVLEDPNLTRWQKFKAGGYSFGNISRRFAGKLALKQKKVEYIENLIENKQSMEDERERLLVHMLQVKVLNTFNMYRIPFLGASFAFCLLTLFRWKQPLYLRMMPTFFLGSFSSLYNF